MAKKIRKSHVLVDAEEPSCTMTTGADRAGSQAATLDVWERCYESSYREIITPDSFQHPAKMSRSLLERIYDHAFAEGWLREGSVVCDPFGGIGSTGILGAYHGVRVVCVELEQKFVDLAEQNFKLHDNAWRKLGCPRPVMIQGDSRQLSEIIGQAECIVSSPPFGNSLESKDTEFREKSTPGRTNKCSEYGSTPGQLGSMKPGDVSCVISSPPYAETLKGDGTLSETAAESRDKRRTEGGSLGQSQRTQGYGSKGNLGNLRAGSIKEILPCTNVSTAENQSLSTAQLEDVERVIAEASLGCSRANDSAQTTSPKCEQMPLAEHSAKKLAGKSVKVGSTGKPSNQNQDTMRGVESASDVSENIYSHGMGINASIAEETGRDFTSIISSPKPTQEANGIIQTATFKPFVSTATPANTSIVAPVLSAAKSMNQNAPKEQRAHVNAGGKGSIDNTANVLPENETFWSASVKILYECFKILRPGGIAIFVVKSFVRAGRIVDFPGDWRKAAESVGFVTLHEHHASLVKEDRKPSLFGHEIVKRTERKSFFRRLAEAKGSPRIDYETILCMTKPLPKNLTPPDTPTPPK